MASVVRSSIRRWNGDEWDYVYFTTDSTIVALGKAIELAGNGQPFLKGTIIDASESVNSILEKILDRLVYLDNTTIPALERRSGNIVHATTTLETTGNLVPLSEFADLGPNDQILMVCVNRETMVPAIDYFVDDVMIRFTANISAGSIVHLISLRQ